MGFNKYCAKMLSGVCQAKPRNSHSKTVQNKIIHRSRKWQWISAIFRHYFTHKYSFNCLAQLLYTRKRPSLRTKLRTHPTGAADYNGRLLVAFMNGITVNQIGFIITPGTVSSTWHTGSKNKRMYYDRQLVSQTVTRRPTTTSRDRLLPSTRH